MQRGVDARRGQGSGPGVLSPCGILKSAGRWERRGSLPFEAQDQHEKEVSPLLGYTGKLLRADLTGRTLKDEPLDLETASAFVGGSGYATRIINDEVPGDTDPLGPANKLVFMTGPTTATSLPTTARYEVCTKSPLTNMWLDASSSGWWARDFKRAGYDGLIVEGAAEAPVYLWINDGKAEIRDASAFWGLDSDQTQEAIRSELGDAKIKVACIGPAGEKQVPLAAVMNDEQRAAGRGGAGAVMGSKNLKAIAVRGSLKVPVADETRLREISKELRARLGGHPVVSQFGPYGTAFLMEHGWVSGDVPNKNWGKGVWREGCEVLNGRVMTETMLVPHAACQGCFIRCARWIKINEGRYAMEGPGPEYETLAAFGTMLMNDDLEAVCWANDLANRYGVDTISTGAAIAFAMEAYEKGVITKEEAGCELTWGNADAIMEMIEQIGTARGLGALLGKGVKRAAAELGRLCRSREGHGGPLPRSPRLLLDGDDLCHGAERGLSHAWSLFHHGAGSASARYRDPARSRPFRQRGQGHPGQAGSGQVLDDRFAGHMRDALRRHGLCRLRGRTGGRHRRALDRGAGRTDRRADHQPSARLQPQMRHNRGRRQAAQEAPRGTRRGQSRRQSARHGRPAGGLLPRAGVGRERSPHPAEARGVGIGGDSGGVLECG
jgi:hypothetical protein